MVFQKTDRLAEKNRRADKAEEVEDEETDKHIDNTYSRSENTQTLVIYIDRYWGYSSRLSRSIVLFCLICLKCNLYSRILYSI